MDDGDKPEGRGYVDQDGERPKLAKVMDNARLAAQRRIRLRPSGIGGLAGPGDGVGLTSARHPGVEPTPEEERDGTDSGAFSEASLEQVEVDSKGHHELRQEKRVSKVFTLHDWPRGTRWRKWGILHDQIWFYDTPPDEPWAYGFNNVPGEPRLMPDGHWWRLDGGAWLRLYMDRKMLWLGRLKFRIHRFYSGDDDSAPHDHPWAFVTFPLSDYYETVSLRYKDGKRGFTEYRTVRCVSRWRFHYRPALYRHFVLEPERPFTTLVVTWSRGPDRVWGFWPQPDRFVPYDEWTKYV